MGGTDLQFSEDIVIEPKNVASTGVHDPETKLPSDGETSMFQVMLGGKLKK